MMISEEYISETMEYIIVFLFLWLVLGLIVQYRDNSKSMRDIDLMTYPSKTQFLLLLSSCLFLWPIERRVRDLYADLKSKGKIR